MSVSKMDIFDKLIEGYVKVPPSLKEQAITTLAIHLCQNVELKEVIRYESEPLQYELISCDKWETLIQVRLPKLCRKLQLPPVLKNELIHRIPPIALQIYNWNVQQDMFHLSPLFVNSCLKPSDWTVVDRRLDEKKIAKRLTEDERIPVLQRYRMACFYCLKYIIPSLWGQISPEIRCNYLFLQDKLESVPLWYGQLDGLFQELLPSEEGFWYDLLKAGVRDGSRSTVLQCCGELDISARQDSIKDIALTAVFRFDVIDRECNYDIFFFLLTQMSKEQRVELFQKIFQNVEITRLLLKWPYLELLVPIIKELWNILAEVKYLCLLFILSRHCWGAAGRKDYLDYEYGYVMTELLDETPDHFKRYVFRNKYEQDNNISLEINMLYIILNEGHYTIHNRKFFKHIWKHITPEKKRLFLRSYFGKKLCFSLAQLDHWELYNSIVRECLPEGEIPKFIKAVSNINYNS